MIGRITLMTKIIPSKIMIAILVMMIAIMNVLGMAILAATKLIK